MMDKKVYEKIWEMLNEKIDKQVKCEICWSDFPIYEKDLEFYEKISPVIDWKKFHIPTPKKCPSCRLIEATCFLNDNVLYKRECDMTWKPMIWVYSEDKKMTVYSSEAWFSDKWEPMDYWMDYDYERWFFEQFAELFERVPKINYWSLNSENSDYSLWINLKNCYILLIWGECENCCYCERVVNCKDCIDCWDTKNSSLCYECVWCNDCYKCFFCEELENCQECYFSANLINCNNCIFCNNLSNKSYCIENKQYSKDQFEKISNEIYSKLWNHSELIILKKQYSQILKKSIKKSLNIISSENSIWYNIQNCNNVKFVNFWNDSENCRYARMSNGGNDSYDTDAYKSHFCYQVHYWMDTYNSLFSIPYFENNKYLLYSMYCVNCEHLFGCVWLRNKKYCVFNKQYTKDEYETIISKIIDKMTEDWEWWEFFPIWISPFGYNESPAYEINQLNESEATKAGYKWQSNYFPINVPSWIAQIKVNDLQDNIRDIEDSILNKAIICKESWKPFRIVKYELDFYKRYNISIPRTHYNERHLERLKRRKLGIDLYLSNCDCCGKEMLSQFEKSSDQIVYCEECYNNMLF